MVLTKIEKYMESVHGTYVFNGQVHSFTSTMCEDILYLTVFCNKQVTSYGLRYAYDDAVPAHIGQLGRRISMSMFPERNKV